MLKWFCIYFPVCAHALLRQWRGVPAHSGAAAVSSLLLWIQKPLMMSLVRRSAVSAVSGQMVAPLRSHALAQAGPIAWEKKPLLTWILKGSVALVSLFYSICKDATAAHWFFANFLSLISFLVVFCPTCSPPCHCSVFVRHFWHWKRFQQTKDRMKRVPLRHLQLSRSTGKAGNCLMKKYMAWRMGEGSHVTHFTGGRIWILCCFCVFFLPRQWYAWLLKCGMICVRVSIPFCLDCVTMSLSLVIVTSSSLLSSLLSDTVALWHGALRVPSQDACSMCLSKFIVVTIFSISKRKLWTFWWLNIL